MQSFAVGDEAEFFSEEYFDKNLNGKKVIIEKAFKFNFEIKSNKHEERPAYYVRFKDNPESGLYLVSFLHLIQGNI